MHSVHIEHFSDDIEYFFDPNKLIVHNVTHVVVYDDGGTIRYDSAADGPDDIDHEQCPFLNSPHLHDGRLVYDCRALSSGE